MEYLLDTVAIIRYLSKSGYIPLKIKEIFSDANNGRCTLVISSISLMELLYLSDKKRINLQFESTLEKIIQSNIYRIVNLSPEILLTATNVNFKELHDRMILATAKHLDIPVISSDSKFKDMKDIQVLWK